MPEACLPDVGLYYEVSGPSDGPWVTFSGSLLTDLHTWDPQAQALAGRYRLLRYDQRGHGRSGLGTQDLSFELLADDLLRLLNLLQVPSTHVVGASMGGSTGAVLAAAHQERVRSLVIASSRPYSGPGADAFWAGRAELARTAGMAALAEPTLSRWFSPATVAADPPELRQLRRAVLATPLAGFIATARLLGSYDLRHVLPRIGCPALLVAGELDLGATDGLREACGLLHEAELHIVGGAGHLPGVERPAEFNEAVAVFLSRIETREPAHEPHSGS